jgi:hypothetical protein
MNRRKRQPHRPHQLVTITPGPGRAMLSGPGLATQAETRCDGLEVQQRRHRDNRIGGIGTGWASCLRSA